MSKIENAVWYIIAVWDEATGKTWRERPDHVQQQFLEAEKELRTRQFQKVVLPDYKPMDVSDCEYYINDGWNTCLDEIKKLNSI